MRTVQGAPLDLPDDIWPISIKAYSDGNNNGMLIWFDFLSSDDEHGSIPFSWNPETEEFTYGTVTKELGGGFDAYLYYLNGVWMYGNTYAFSGEYHVGDHNIGIWLGEFPSAGGYNRGDRLYYNPSDVDAFSLRVSKLNDGLIGFCGNYEIKTLTCNGLVLEWAGSAPTNFYTAESMLVNMPSEAMPTKFVIVMDYGYAISHRLAYLDTDGITPVLVGDSVLADFGEIFEKYLWALETMSVDVENECLFYTTVKESDKEVQNMFKVHCPDTGVTSAEFTREDLFPTPTAGSWGFYNNGNLYIVGVRSTQEDPIIVWDMTPQ